MFEEFTPERLREIEARWKSDVDRKLDRVVRFIDKNEALLIMLTEREIDRKALRKAIIEKSLAGLIYGSVAAVIALIWTGAKAELMTLIDAMRAIRK